MSRKRDYDGQPHTDYGERGKRLVEGLTMRDICDCFIRGVFLSASHVAPDLYAEADKGEDAELDKNDLYKISYHRVDPGAICQNMMCEVERMMGIFPNISKPDIPDSDDGGG